MDPGRGGSIKWHTDNQEEFRQIIQPAFQKDLTAHSMEKEGMEERRADKRKAMHADLY